MLPSRHQISFSSIKYSPHPHQILPPHRILAPFTDTPPQTSITRITCIECMALTGGRSIQGANVGANLNSDERRSLNFCQFYELFYFISHALKNYFNFLKLFFQIYLQTIDWFRNLGRANTKINAVLVCKITLYTVLLLVLCDIMLSESRDWCSLYDHSWRSGRTTGIRLYHQIPSVVDVF